LLLFGMCKNIVFSYTLSETEYIGEYYRNRINVFADRFTATDDETKNAIDLKVLCENIDGNGYDLCYVFSGTSTEEEGYKVVDGCMFKYTSAQEPYALGWYLISDSEVLTLEEACENRIVTLNGEEGKIIRRFLNLPLVAEFKGKYNNHDELFYTFKDYLSEFNAYTEKTPACFLGAINGFEIVTYQNSLCGKYYDEYIGGYLYSVDNCQSPFELGVYGIKENKVFTLTEMYNCGVDMETLNVLLTGAHLHISESAEIITNPTVEIIPSIPSEAETTVTSPITIPTSTVITVTEPAESETSAPDNDKENLYEDIFVERLDIEEKSGEEVLYIYEELFYYYGDSGNYSPDYVLVMAASPYVVEGFTSTYFGDYIIRTCYYSPYTHAYYIYIPTDDKIYTLEEAYYAEISGIEEVLKFLNGTAVALIGDADADFSLNIKDATWIQKYLAGFVELYEPCSHSQLTDEACDFNRDGQINIRDATAIQKYIAGII